MTDIEKLKEIVKGKVLSLHAKVDFDEWVNETYIRTVEAGLEPKMSNFTKYLSEVVNEYRNQKSDGSDRYITETQFIYCKKCKEDLPVALFGTTVRKATGKKVFQTYCSPCMKDKMKEHRKSKPKISKRKNPLKYNYPPDCSTSKQKQSFRHKIWQAANIEHVLDYQRKQYNANA